MQTDRARLQLQLGQPLELMGLKEVADAVGSKPSNVRDLADLPEPVIAYLPNRPLWLASEVRAFAAERKRRARW